MGGVPLLDAFEGVTLGGKGNDANRTVAEQVRDRDVAVGSRGACRRDANRKAAFGGHHLVGEIGPVTEVAEDSAAFRLAAVPVVVRDLVTGDEPVLHDFVLLAPQLFADPVAKRTAGPVEA